LEFLPLKFDIQVEVAKDIVNRRVGCIKHFASEGVHVPRVDQSDDDRSDVK